MESNVSYDELVSMLKKAYTNLKLQESVIQSLKEVNEAQKKTIRDQKEIIDILDEQVSILEGML